MSTPSTKLTPKEQQKIADLKKELKITQGQAISILNLIKAFKPRQHEELKLETNGRYIELSVNPLKHS